jgi:hypothetical protein
VASSGWCGQSSAVTRAWPRRRSSRWGASLKSGAATPPGSLWCRAATTVRPVPRGRTIRQGYVELDGCTVVKAPTTFSRVWDRRYLAQLDGAAIAVGHSRWATRGSPDAVANASPMVVGRLIGTHNGDVDEDQLLQRYQLGRRLGGTDTEVLFGVIERAGAEPTEIAAVLSAVVGRAALAWVDRGQADRVHLARAALSPLAIARDRERNFYWASNPRWFRVLDVKGRFGFRGRGHGKGGLLPRRGRRRHAPRRRRAAVPGPCTAEGCLRRSGGVAGVRR